MKATLLLSTLLGSGVSAFPWLSPDFNVESHKRGLDAIKRDPELAKLIDDLLIKQREQKDQFFSSYNSTEDCEDAAAGLDRRQTTNCRSHPLSDFLPTTVAGLKKFPEAAYPYQDPKPSDQRGACPGLNTMANHGYIPRSGIVTVAQSIKASADVFNMGADLTAFLAGGSVIFAGDIPTMTFSIGGADARTNSLGPLGAALGTETGLSGHLRFKEGDASGTRSVHQLNFLSPDKYSLTHICIQMRLLPLQRRQPQLEHSRLQRPANPGKDLWWRTVQCRSRDSPLRKPVHELSL
jgi:hypothetical protein